MGKKILIILTSADCIPKSGKPTGWYLPELAHPYKILVDAGFTDIDFVSPKGGKAPLDPSSVDQYKDDVVCKHFQKNDKVQKLISNTKTPEGIKGSDYAAVIYPGGHGPMIDLATDQRTAKITAECYENGGVVAAVCHGPAGILNVKLSNGEFLVKGKTVTCFTNAEEEQAGFTNDMPFALETELKTNGATFKCAEKVWEACVQVDGRLVTGQNPASSTPLGEKIVELLK